MKTAAKILTVVETNHSSQEIIVENNECCSDKRNDTSREEGKDEIHQEEINLMDIETNEIYEEPLERNKELTDANYVGFESEDAQKEDATTNKSVYLHRRRGIQLFY